MHYTNDLGTFTQTFEGNSIIESAEEVASEPNPIKSRF